MADYPSLAQYVGTDFTLDDSRVVLRGSDGKARVSVLSDAAKRSFALSHVLDNTELDTLMTFYTDNRALSFNVTYKGVVYVCVFAGAPRVQPGEVFHRVTVPLMEV